MNGGDGGIRTLDRALQPYNGLANRRLQPLGHISRRTMNPGSGPRRIAWRRYARPGQDWQVFRGKKKGDPNARWRSQGGAAILRVAVAGRRISWGSAENG